MQWASRHADGDADNAKYEAITELTTGTTEHRPDMEAGQLQVFERYLLAHSCLRLLFIVVGSDAGAGHEMSLWLHHQYFSIRTCSIRQADTYMHFFLFSSLLPSSYSVRLT